MRYIQRTLTVSAALAFGAAWSVERTPAPAPASFPASFPASSPAPAPAGFPAGSLIGDRDSVFGIEDTYWNPDQVWKRVNYIRIRNQGDLPTRLDSIRLPPDSLAFRDQAYARRLDILFAIRVYAGGLRKLVVFNGELNRMQVTLNPGDSADIGLFEIGNVNWLVKESAAAKWFYFGDTLVAPVTLFAGPDSLRFILKAKVMNVIAGSGIAPLIPGRLRIASGSHPVTADGRRLPKGVRQQARHENGKNPAASRMLFGGP